MKGKEAYSQFVENFKGKETFTKKDIALYFSASGLALSDSALRWRIHKLKELGVITTVGRSVYSLESKPRFLPEPDKFARKVVRLFKQRFDVDYCIWETRHLHNFMLHQPFRYFYVLETDKDITESVFYHLKDNNIKVFHNPSLQIMEEYVLGEDEVVLIKPLVSRPLLTKTERIVVPDLEKILVDIFCDRHQFFMFGGQEMIYIFENAIHHYNINFTSLYAYAARRGKREVIKSFIQDKIIG